MGKKEKAAAPKKTYYLDHINRQKTIVDSTFKPVAGFNVEKVSLKEYSESKYSAAIVMDGAPEGFEVPAKK